MHGETSEQRLCLFLQQSCADSRCCHICEETRADRNRTMSYGVWAKWLVPIGDCWFLSATLQSHSSVTRATEAMNGVRRYCTSRSYRRRTDVSTELPWTPCSQWHTRTAPDCRTVTNQPTPPYVVIAIATRHMAIICPSVCHTLVSCKTAKRRNSFTTGLIALSF